MYRSVIQIFILESSDVMHIWKEFHASEFGAMLNLCI